MIGFELPESRRDAVLREFPETGARWIADYPKLVEACVARWELVLTQSVTTGLPINMVYMAETTRGETRVLKIGHPHPEQLTEMIALRCYQGRSAVKLLDADESLGAILLERLDPGTTLRQYLNRQSESWRVRKDHPSIRAAIMLITDLPVLDMEATPEEGLPTYAQWMGKSFAEFRHKNKHDVEYLGWLLAAEEAFGLLDASRGETCLLHGDLHHENILLDQQRGWVAIDPKGVIGPKILECGRFLHNFLHDETDDAVTGAGYLEQLCDILSARYLALSEILGYKLIDLARVAFIDVTLSTSWTMNGFSSSGSWSRKRGVQLVRATYLALLELETNSGKLKR